MPAAGDEAMRLWHGRHIGPLLTAWIILLAITAGLYGMESAQPALSELVVPLYVILALSGAFATWRWFRARARGTDRRRGDRRHTDRRD